MASHYLPSFQPIWSADDVLDVAAACAKALKARENIEKGAATLAAAAAAVDRTRTQQRERRIEQETKTKGLV